MLTLDDAKEQLVTVMRRALRDGLVHATAGNASCRLDDGNVAVTSRHGETGVFTPDGEWIEGDLHHADPHLCGWLAGPQLPPRLDSLPRFRSIQETQAS